jgi:hypothetical protein
LEKALNLGTRTNGRERIIYLGLSAREKTKEIISVYEDLIEKRINNMGEYKHLHSNTA